MQGFSMLAAKWTWILWPCVIAAVVVAARWLPRSAVDPPANAIGTPLERKGGMVLVRGGYFMMGNDLGAADARPAHEVFVRPFWIDQYEVTNAQFTRFVEATGYVTTAERVGRAWVFDSVLRKWQESAGANWRHPGGGETTIAGRETAPVVQVSWHDAVAFTEWAGKRFPTEAEWEFAARGGLADADYPWGREELLQSLYQANYWQGRFPFENSELDGYGGLAPVGRYLPNPYGLLDMAGNAAEWCADLYSAEYYPVSPNRNPIGPAVGGNLRVVRGGSWVSAASSGAGHKVWVRDKLEAFQSNNHTGFRCAEDAP